MFSMRSYRWPDATEKISHRMPTFFLNGNLVYFAAFTNHIGFYPGASGVAAFAGKLEPYHTGKGSIQLPYDEPLPLDLIASIVRFRVDQNAARPVRRRAATA